MRCATGLYDDHFRGLAVHNDDVDALGELTDIAAAYHSSRQVVDLDTLGAARHNLTVFNYGVDIQILDAGSDFLELLPHIRLLVCVSCLAW